jgi:subtilisin-like proprotein convertase family protein
MNALKRGAIAAMCLVVAAVFLIRHSGLAQMVDKSTQGRTIYVDPVTGKRDTANIVYSNKPSMRGGPSQRVAPPPAPPGFTATTTSFTQSTPTHIPPGPAVVTSTLNVSGAGPFLLDVDFFARIPHTFASDLDITLMSPAGTIVTITTDNGSGNDSVYNGTLWDDDANPGGQVPYTTNDGMTTDHAYVNRTVATPLTPEEPFGAFVGENPNGIWTLTVSDDAGGDSGDVNIWRLDITTIGGTPPTISETFSSDTTAIAIPDTTTVLKTITVSTACTYLMDLNLTTFITHTDNSDLDMTITSPSGTVVTLGTDNGLSNDNAFNGTFWDDDADTTGQVPYTTNTGLVTDHPYTNLVTATPLAPEEALAAFIGENPNGVWTLRIRDDAVTDVGSFRSWQMNLRCVLPVATNAPPAFVSPTPTCGSTINGTAGQPITFTVRASDPNTGQTVTLSSGALPTGATMTPALPTSGNPVQSVFNWTPSTSQTGNFTIIYTARDNAEIPLAATCTLTVNVAPATTNNTPEFDAAVGCGTTVNATVGVLFSRTIRATDTNAGQIVTLTSGALPTGATMTPALPTSGNPVQSVLNWTPTSSQIGIATIIYTATDNATPPLSTTCTLRVNVQAATDPNPPSCAVTQIIPGPPKQIRVTIQDTQSGLASIVVVTATNATVSIPSFTVGTTSPVIVTATKTNQSLPSTVVLRATDVAGNAVECDPVYTTISAPIPQSFGLGSNYPNPFNPTTRINFSVAQSQAPTHVTLRVFDVLGREVRTLIAEPMQPGVYSAEWDGKDNNGITVPSGVYLYRMVAGDFSASRRMVLSK